MREIKFRAWFPQDAREGKSAMGEVHSSYEGQSLNDFIADAVEIGIILMQYTGLKDKNGKEIYEGDVLRAAGYVGYRVEDLPSFWMEHAEMSAGFNHWEIVGNIYESPGLLEKEDE
jgi:hypothetical protein